MRPSYEELGLRTLYLGDEAVIDLASFSLEGRAIRKVRQSVSRLVKAGYEAELHELRSLGGEEIAQAERVIEQGRQGAPERGFSMAMDSLCGQHCGETLVVLARDAEGEIRGVLHFVPCHGRRAVSLSFMRRDPRTPNGLTEFLVVRAAELLREQGLTELSLNFATFARWMHSPERWHERVLGKLVAIGNPVLPDREPVPLQREVLPPLGAAYLVYEGTFGLPRVGLAAMWAEGQLPKPRLPQRRTPAAAR
jgi:lysyl-tRNA synthetase class 2